MGAYKNMLFNIETAADDIIRKETGERRFFGVYKWEKGIGGKYFSAVIETSKGYFCALYLTEKNKFTLSKFNEWNSCAIEISLN